jgi:hypothetical protein
MKGITTEVEDGVLKIRDENQCNWVRSYKKEINIYLQCRELSKIIYSGAGNVTGMNTIVSDSMEYDFWSGSGVISMDIQCRLLHANMHTGPGDAILTGTAQSAYYYSNGNGKLKCDGLKAEHVDFDWVSTNDCWINCSNDLTGTIGYIGNVYYTGNPAVIQVQEKDQGQLIPF